MNQGGSISRSFGLLFLALSVALGAGCSSGGGGGSNVPITNNNDQGGQTQNQSPLTEVLIAVQLAQLPVGGTTSLTAVGRYQDGGFGLITSQVSWSAVPAGVVSIDSAGVLTAVSPGTASVVGSVGAISSVPLVIEVPDPNQLQSLALVATPTTIPLSGSSALTVTAHYTNGSSVDVTGAVSWVVSNPAVLGVISGSPAAADPLAVGSAAVHATFFGLVSNNVTITVENTINPPNPSTLLVPRHPAPYTWTATPAQAAVGNPSNAWYGQRAKAKWDVVPYQYVSSSTFELSVIAAHQSVGTVDNVPGDMGMKRVWFACNGGFGSTVNDVSGWLPVDEITMNSTHLFGFKVTVDVASFPGPGRYEFRYVAEPVHGVPVVGESLFLYIDPSGTAAQEVRYVAPGGTGNGSSLSSPMGTIAQAAAAFANPNNALILLGPGNNVWGTTQGRADNADAWLTVRRAPSVANRSDCRITSFANIDVRRVKVEGVRLDVSLGHLRGQVGNEDVWLHDCHLVGAGGDPPAYNSPIDEDRVDEVFVTGTDNPMREALGGVPFGTGTYTLIENMTMVFEAGKLVRNVYMRQIAEDFFRYDDSPPGLIGNVACESFPNSGHNDTFQCIGRSMDYSPFIVNLYAKRMANRQGIFMDNSINATHNAGVVDYAIINALLDNDAAPGGGQRSKWKVGGQNGVMWHCTFANGWFEWTPHRQDEGGTNASTGYQTSWDGYRPHDYASVRNSTFLRFGWHWTGGNGTPNTFYSDPGAPGPRNEFDVNRNDFEHNHVYSRSGGSYEQHGNGAWYDFNDATSTNTSSVGSTLGSDASDFNSIFANFLTGDVRPNPNGWLDGLWRAAQAPHLAPEVLVPFDILGNRYNLTAPSVGALERNPQ
ncbi:MAG: Ig-like domain-containing protein [Planctomycetota bacterium]